MASIFGDARKEVQHHTADCPVGICTYPKDGVVLTDGSLIANFDVHQPII